MIRLFISLIACAIGGLACNAGSQPLLPEQIVSSSIAMVSVNTSSGTAIRASGFVWPDTNHVVTAFHVIAAANSVTVSFDDGATVMAATVLKTFRDRDLALLAIDSPPSSITPISIAAGPPPAGSEVTAIGYPQGLATRQPLKGSLVAQGPGLAAETLGALLASGPLRDSLNDLGFPSLDRKILLLQAPLQPGMSGGPVVNQGGKLVGIANGGLEKGFGEITWAIPSDALHQLAQQDGVESGPNHQLLTTLFGAELAAAADSPSRKFGSLRLTKLRTRTLNQLTQLNDDPQGLLQVAQSLSQSIALISSSAAEDPLQWKFDLYRVDVLNAPPNTPAASIAVPEGTELTGGSAPNDIKARIEDRNLLWKTRVQLASLSQIPPYTIAFEQHLQVQAPGSAWYGDLNWSYPYPHTYPNGFIIQRRLWNGYPFGVYFPPGSVPATTISVVHSAYRGLLVSAATISLQHQTIMPGPYMLPDADMAASRNATWSKLVLATLMCGFSDALAMEGQPNTSAPLQHNW